MKRSILRTDDPEYFVVAGHGAELLVIDVNAPNAEQRAAEAGQIVSAKLMQAFADELGEEMRKIPADEFASSRAAMATAIEKAQARVYGELKSGDFLKRFPEVEPVIDMASGIAVNSFGNVNPLITSAAIQQMLTIGHTSQDHTTATLERVSRTLAKLFGDDKAVVFWTNSGAEANEGVITAMNSYHHLRGEPERNQIIAFNGAFHGRTGRAREAMNFATTGIGPLTGGFVHGEFNNLASVEALIGPRTSGIMVEPVQGEGGIVPATKAFMEGLRALADKHGALLHLDEVQAGMGRTGKVYAHQHFGIQPDCMSTAKALSGGVGAAVAAFVVSGKMNDVLTDKGAKRFSHGSTFGGSPLAVTLAEQTLQMVQQAEHIGAPAQENAAHLRKRLEEIAAKLPEGAIKDVRGLGFMQAMELDPSLSNAEAMTALRQEGVFVMDGRKNTLRLLPPLNITAQEIDMATVRMESGLQKFVQAKFPPSTGKPFAAVDVAPEQGKQV